MFSRSFFILLFTLNIFLATLIRLLFTTSEQQLTFNQVFAQSSPCFSCMLLFSIDTLIDSLMFRILSLCVPVLFNVHVLLWVSVKVDVVLFSFFKCFFTRSIISQDNYFSFASTKRDLTPHGTLPFLLFIFITIPMPWRLS